MSFRLRGMSVAMVGVLLLVVALPRAFGETGRRISVGDDPALKEGSPTLVLVEISDFQCPFCGRAAREVIPKVEEKFVRTGKVELVFLDLPLQMHPYAYKAAEAAACAGDQKKFWAMHHRLFANQGDLSAERLPVYAREAGLDVAAFQACLASGRHGEEIHQDAKEARRLGIGSTPYYLIGRRIPGGDEVEVLKGINGLPPYEYLETALNELLAEGKTPK
jgi:protein-disulfide isomerase